jgi:hypothetical protein
MTVDEYEYDKHHRPTFPYEWQWEQFQGLQRVRFWMWAILGFLSIVMFGLLLWETFADGAGKDFFVGMTVGTLLSCLTFSVTRPRFMRWLTRLGKREGD